MDRSAPAVLDEYLVLQCQGGDTEAFTALVRRWQPGLTRHALQLTGQREAAADVVQETWLAVAQGVRRLDDPACFPRWLFQVATRKCADWVREQQRQRRLTAELAATASEAAEPREEPSADDIGALRQALCRLPSDRRALLAMSYLDGLSIPAIAEALGLPPGTVKSRLYHARQELKVILQRSIS